METNMIVKIINSDTLLISTKAYEECITALEEIRLCKEILNFLIREN